MNQKKRNTNKLKRAIIISIISVVVVVFTKHENYAYIKYHTHKDCAEVFTKQSMNEMKRGTEQNRTEQNKTKRN